MIENSYHYSEVINVLSGDIYFLFSENQLFIKCS